MKPQCCFALSIASVLYFAVFQCAGAAFAPNDNFADRAILTGSFFDLTNSNFAASCEPGEKRHDRRASGSSIWYSWTAPTNGWAIFGATAFEFNPVVVVYRGEKLKRLRRIAGGLGDGVPRGNGLFVHTAVASFKADAGATYSLVVDGEQSYYGAPRGQVEIGLMLSTIQVANPTDGSAHKNNEAVTLAVTPPNPDVDGALKSVDYMTVRPGGAVQVLGRASTAPFSITVSNLLPGAVPLLALATNTLGEPRISPPIVFHVRPHNDAFADSVLFRNYEWTTVAALAGATVERGERARGGTVWYSWIAPADGVATVLQHEAAETTRTTISTGNSVRKLRRIAVLRGYDTVEIRVVGGQIYHFSINDPQKHSTIDYPSARLTVNLDTPLITGITNNAVFAHGDPVPLEVALPTVGTAIERVEFLAGTNVIAGSTSPTFGTQWSTPRPGMHQLNARVILHDGIFILGHPIPITVRPANDFFGERTLLTETNVVAPVFTQTATIETNEPEHGVAPNPHTSWWSWTAPADGTLVLDVLGEPVPALALYTGEALSSLNLVAQNIRYDPGKLANVQWRELLVRVTAGATYQLAAAGGNDSSSVWLRFFGAPANDGFGNGTPIIGSSTLLTGTTLGATAEPGEPAALDGDAARESVWWRWTPSNDGLVRLDTSATDVLHIDVFTGGTLAEMNRVPLLPRQTNAASFNVIAGAEYAIRVDARADSVRAFTLNFQFVEAPPNDQFANRIALSGVFASFAVSNFAAGREPGEPGDGDHSVWFTWTAPETGQLLVPGAAYEGDSLESLTSLTRRPPDYGFGVVEGRTYAIAIVTEAGIFADFAGELRLLPTPSNDDFANRATLTGVPANVRVSTAGATWEEEDPRPRFVFVEVYGSRSVWWTWEAPASGNVEITTSQFIGEVSTAVFVGSSLGMLTEVPGSKFGNGLAFHATTGVPYQIALYGWHGLSNEVDLLLDMPPPPPNDNFANRQILTGDTWLARGTNIGATVESGEPSIPASGARTVWYSWQAPRSGVVAITNAGTPFQIVLRLYQGTNLQNLRIIQTSGDAMSSAVEAGGVYHLSLDGNSLAGILKVGLAYQNPVAMPVPFEDERSSQGPRLIIERASNAATLVVHADQDGWVNVDTSSDLRVWESLGVFFVRRGVNRIEDRGRLPVRRFYRLQTVRK